MGLRGMIVLFLRESRKRHTQRSSKKKVSTVDGMHSVKFKKEVMKNGVEEGSCN